RINAKTTPEALAATIDAAADVPPREPAKEASNRQSLALARDTVAAVASMEEEAKRALAAAEAEVAKLEHMEACPVCLAAAPGW
ncbi:hypothetical protein, partial [Bacillus cereus group sp. BC319]|uniref:hypothetical protein n=1 Tax=Bacillus cereus group sp. BC319 TaxID=3445312 RepID=UPI003F27AD05